MAPEKLIRKSEVKHKSSSQRGSSLLSLRAFRSFQFIRQIIISSAEVSISYKAFLVGVGAWTSIEGGSTIFTPGLSGSEPYVLIADASESWLIKSFQA